MRKRRIGTAKFFTLLLLLYHTSANGAGFYQLILMDIGMPVMDGYTAAKEIRTLDDVRLAQIPIVALSANVFDEDRIKAIHSGMNEHIAKPIDLEELYTIMERVITL